MSRFENTFFEYFNNLKMYLRSQPLNLGGIAVATDGNGGTPPGGFIGWLPQTRVAYDSSEAALSGYIADSPFNSSGVLISGSLLDNLNHIRYRITVLEGGGGGAGSLLIKEGGVLISSGVTVIDFYNADVVETSPGQVTVTCSGSGGGGGSTTFSGLSDTPNSYVGQAGKLVAVTDAEDGVEFITVSGVGGSSDGYNHNFYTTTSGYTNIVDSGTNMFPSLIETSAGNFLTAYIYDTGSKLKLVKRTSTDYGNTWSAQADIYQDGTYDMNAPGLVKIANGDVVLTTGVCTGYTGSVVDGGRVIISHDDGVNWDSPITINSSFVGYTLASTPVIQLSNGNLLLAIYGLKDVSDTLTSVSVFTSTDNGASWGSEVLVGDGDTDSKDYAEPALALMENGNVLLMCRDEVSDYFHTAISDDNGATWTALESKFSATGRPGLIKLYGGTLAVIYRNSSDGTLCVRSSFDNGQTWTSDADVFVIDDLTGYEQSYYSGQYETSYGVLAVIYTLGDAFTATYGHLRFKYIINNGFLNPQADLVVDGFRLLGDFTKDTTDLVTNLNADMLDGYHSSYFLTSTGGELLVGDNYDILFDDAGDVIYEG